MLVEISDKHLGYVAILTVLPRRVNKLDCPTYICNFWLVAHQDPSIPVSMNVAPTQLLLKDTLAGVFGRAAGAGELRLTQNSWKGHIVEDDVIPVVFGAHVLLVLA